jgi:RimJ/RimL family protein N-acetyltransferase
MTEHKDRNGMRVGAPLQSWTPPPMPPRVPMEGLSCRLVPLEPSQHAADLFAANSLDKTGENFTYLFTEPFDDLATYRAYLEVIAPLEDPQVHTIIDKASGKAVGVASYMRIDPKNGVIEVGGINYSPLLQNKIAGTEAMFLMMRRAFELGYRRYEWKCDSCNEPSKRAARRLGFTYEGRFRQAVVYKGRNRDTDWFSIIDSEWPRLKHAFETWLDPANFDAQGWQIAPLRARAESGQRPA